MDPNETLKWIRAAVETLRSEEPADREFFAAVEALTENSAALDQWLSRGGYLPDEWAEGQDVRGQAADYARDDQ